MDVALWRTPAAFSPWTHVQAYIDRIDSTVYRAAIEFAQGELLGSARPCHSCGKSAAELTWFSISDAEDAWEVGEGRVGFLTLCNRCHLQVDFLVDRDLTELQANQWRESCTLS